VSIRRADEIRNVEVVNSEYSCQFNLAVGVGVYCSSARFTSVAKTHLTRRGRSWNQEAGEMGRIQTAHFPMCWFKAGDAQTCLSRLALIFRVLLNEM
jgi:hypothetical protein